MILLEMLAHSTFEENEAGINSWLEKRAAQLNCAQVPELSAPIPLSAPLDHVNSVVFGDGKAQQLVLYSVNYTDTRPALIQLKSAVPVQMRVYVCNFDCYAWSTFWDLMWQINCVYDWYELHAVGSEDAKELFEGAVQAATELTRMPAVDAELPAFVASMKVVYQECSQVLALYNQIDESALLLLFREGFVQRWRESQMSNLRSNITRIG